MASLGDAVNVAPEMVTSCPSCGARHSGAVVLGEKVEQIPETGSVGMCVYCLGWHEWTAPGKAEVRTLKQILDSVRPSKRPELVMAYASVADFHAKRVREGTIRLTVDGILPPKG